jgi:hypothetical protein
MKRFNALAILVLGCMASLSAQSKFDVSAGEYLGHVRANTRAAMMRSRGVQQSTLAPEITAEQRVAVLVTMKEAGMGYILAENGYEIENELGRIVIARLTAPEMEAVAELDEVVQVSLGFEAEPMMRVARKTTKVDDVHKANASSGLSHGYTGEGVIVGMMDTGLDPNHLNFRDAAGNLRIKNYWEIKGADGSVVLYDTPEKIGAFETDLRQETHATHVLGIMAGSHNARPGSGNGMVATLNGLGKPSVSASNINPYYGVAKDAEMSVCSGTLENNNITIAAGRFRDYVKSTGKPGVLNFSLGNQRGPHDGTDASSLALADVGKDVLICMSAGNEGNANISLSKTLTASDKTVRTFVSTGLAGNGYLDIWSSGPQTLKVTFAAINLTNGNIVGTFEIPTPSSFSYIGGTSVRYSNVVKNAQFGNTFGQSSFIGYSANLNTANNRYDVYLTFELSGSNANTAAAIIVEGTDGNKIDMYGSMVLRSNGMAGYLDGTPTNSINGLACGDNILVVGAYVNSNPYMTLGGESSWSSTTYPQGGIAAFSSYGHTFQGRQLPDVVGPGMGMISSYNSYYVRDEINNYVTKGLANPVNTKTEAQLRTEAESGYSVWINSPDKKDPDDMKTPLKNYWGEMSGTSMSSPFVAGVLALWSQAAAEKGVRLSMDDVKKVIAATADKDEFTAQQPERWGMGKINALAGLKYILANQVGGVDGIASDDPESSLIIEPVGGGVYSVFLAGVEGFTATLHNLQGQAVATASATGNELTLDGSALGRGVYVLTVQAPNTRISRKIAL